MTRRAFDIIFYRGSKCFPLKAGPALGLGHLGYGLWPPNIERSPLIWGGKSTHSRCGKYLAHLPHQTQKTSPIRCCICAKFLHFVSVPLQICNSTDTDGKLKNIILFNFSLSSHFFIWFSLSLLRICLSLSPKFPTCSSSSHNRTRARRRCRRRRRRWRPIIVILHNHHLSQPQPSPQQQNPNPKKPNKPTIS